MEKSEILAILNEAYFSPQHHEKDTLEHLPQLLRGAATFVDVGASLGQYTLFASRILRGGRILAVEADPLRHGELARNCERWSAESGNTISAVFAAAAGRDGDTAFFVTHSNVSGGLFPHPIAHQRVEWDEIRVPARTLDTLCEGFSPDLVKIDVEGGELAVLQGARRLLRQGRTRFLVELHGWIDAEGRQVPREVRALMREHRYRAAPFHGQTLFVAQTAEWLRLWLRYCLLDWPADLKRRLGRALQRLR
jgi:FkbM family methyltransferase